MSTNPTADADFAGFAKELDAALSSPTSPAMDRRMREERAATKTAKERARKPVRTAQMNFRVSPAEKAMIKALAAKLEASDADVIVMAIMDLARKHDLAGGAP